MTSAVDSPYRRIEPPRAHHLCSNCRAPTYETDIQKVCIGDIVAACRKVNDASKRDAVELAGVAASGGASPVGAIFSDDPLWLELPPVLTQYGGSLAEIERRKGLLAKRTALCRECCIFFQTSGDEGGTTHRPIVAHRSVLPDIGERRPDRASDYVFTELQAQHRDISKELSDKTRARRRFCAQLSGPLDWDALPKLSHSASRELRLVSQARDNNDVATPNHHASRGPSRGRGDAAADYTRAGGDVSEASLLATLVEPLPPSTVDIDMHVWLEFELWRAMTSVCEFSTVAPVGAVDGSDVAKKGDDFYAVYHSNRNRFPLPAIDALHMPWLDRMAHPLDGRSRGPQDADGTAIDDDDDAGARLGPTITCVPGCTSEEEELFKRAVATAEDDGRPMPTEEQFFMGALSLDDVAEDTASVGEDEEDIESPRSP